MAIAGGTIDHLLKGLFSLFGVIFVVVVVVVVCKSFVLSIFGILSLEVLPLKRKSADDNDDDNGASDDNDESDVLEEKVVQIEDDVSLHLLPREYPREWERTERSNISPSVLQTVFHVWAVGVSRAVRFDKCLIGGCYNLEFSPSCD